SKNQKSKFTFHYKTMKAFNDDKQMRSDWYIPICNGVERIKINGKKAHSTQKPEALLFRIILSTSNTGDIVLDPFMGSGTTGAVAKKIGRNYIGIERESFYIKVANDRIKKVKPINKALLVNPMEVKKPKVPFGNLIESELIKIGSYLFSKDKKNKARILADSTLKINDKVGSIHKVSAEILGKVSNNGWTYWYIKDKKDNFILIDELRDEYIKKYLS
ncbi:site-specific DNA-methyltransferase, partial [bacterium]|nr:site-specific DNA-methyltransferase [bacterium]